MAYRVKFPMALRAAPTMDADRIATIEFESLLEILEELPDAKWVRVKTRIGGEERVGYLLRENIEKIVDAPIPEEIDLVHLMDALIFAAQRFETNYYYLGALAWIESRVRNVVNPSSGAAGPFQFLPSTWKFLVEKYGAETGVDADDIRDVAAQTLFAAIYARDAARVLNEALSRLPSGSELYLAHLLGSAAAAVILNGDRVQAIDVPLRRVYEKRPDAEVLVTKIIRDNEGLLSVEGKPSTVEQVLKEIEERLEGGLREVAKALAELRPESATFKADQPAPPWLVVARAELARPVIEIEGPESNPRIEGYHASTTFGKTHPDDVAWCASFVCWCMANCGNTAVVAANIKSPRAADWLKWGQSIAIPPLGTIAVLKPISPKTSGHVGFVTGLEGGKVKLLGGNQGHPQSVCEVEFALSDVRDFRWLPLD